MTEVIVPQSPDTEQSSNTLCNSPFIEKSSQSPPKDRRNPWAKSEPEEQLQELQVEDNEPEPAPAKAIQIQNTGDTQVVTGSWPSL